MTTSTSIQPDTHELILCSDKAQACETYLFEPGPDEKKLGYLFAAAGTDDREGIGSELLDTIVTAIQREYYRDPNRSPSASFEMALHQANLILHDMSEQGMRDWMPSFQAVVAVLVGGELHLSVAGDGQAILVRKNIVSDISTGLAQIPITNPLQTFSQVATGAIQTRDTIFLGTSSFSSLFADTELARTTTEQSAEQMGLRLHQRYEDLGRTTPLAAVIVSALPQYTAASSSAIRGSDGPVRESRGVNPRNLAPRQPLVITRGTAQKILRILGQSARVFGSFVAQRVWPALKTGSSRSGRVIAQASKVTGKNIQNIAANRGGGMPNIRDIPKKTTRSLLGFTVSLYDRYNNLPKSSKIFAVLSLILVVTLGASIILLQHKRASDTEIQEASEALQSAKTKVEAAKTALIYDNRDQALGLLQEAETAANKLLADGIYSQESQQLLGEIEKQFDRLQRITRASGENITIVGDFSELMKKPATDIFLVGELLYTFDPETNTILSMDLGGTAAIAHQTTQGIGFFTSGKVHAADKTITLLTEPAGVAVFDSKDASLLSQDITFPTAKPQIADIALFGNRLYLLDKSSNNIFSYNKTLRGYSSGTPWIEDGAFPASSITSFAIDGSVYTLHSDGTIRELFKGTAADFEAEAITPTLSADAHIITTEELANLYVIDPSTKRIVVYSKQGQLLKQILVDFATNFSDAAIAPEEDKAYVLDGTRVLEIPLTEQ